jgi:hypothetical protein
VRKVLPGANDLGADASYSTKAPSQAGSQPGTCECCAVIQCAQLPAAEQSASRWTCRWVVVPCKQHSQWCESVAPAFLALYKPWRGQLNDQLQSDVCFCPDHKARAGVQHLLRGLTL